MRAVFVSHTVDTPVEDLCEVAHEQARDLDLLEPGARERELLGLADEFVARCMLVAVYGGEGWRRCRSDAARRYATAPLLGPLIVEYARQ